MTQRQILELMGYGASALVLVSLLMTSVVKLRVINALGAALFTVYGLAIRSYPTALMNGCLVLVDLWFLYKVMRPDHVFSVESAHGNDSALRHFLQVYRGNVANYFHGWNWEDDETRRGYLVYLDATPVGALVGHEVAPGELLVEVDYAAPSHRDFSVGKYLYSRLPGLGVHTLRSRGGDDSHNKYLRSMGFELVDGEYVKKLQ